MSWLDTLDDIRKKDFTKASAADREKACRDVINMASYGCAVVAVSPIPFSDAVLMLPVQSAMVMTVGHIFGRKLTEADARDLLLELGATAGVGLLTRQGLKALLPVVGALLTIPAAYATCWAMGRVSMEYFQNPGTPREQLQKVYEAARKEGKQLFSRARLDEFLKARAQKKAGKKAGKAPAAAPPRKARRKAPPRKRAAP